MVVTWVGTGCNWGIDCIYMVSAGWERNIGVVVVFSACDGIVICACILSEWLNISFCDEMIVFLFLFVIYGSPWL